MNIKILWIVILLLLLNSCSYSPFLTENSKNYTQRTQDFIWGINGHPVVDKEYVESSLQQQLNLLKEHQFSVYRLDVNLSEEGLLKDHREERFDSLLKLGKEMNIDIFPVLKFYNEFIDGKDLNQEEAYLKAKKKGKAFAEKYSNYIQYYGIENELDLKLIYPNAKGTSPMDYDSNKMKITLAYLKGMIAGVKSVDDDAKTIINFGGWYNWGFIKFLLDSDLDFDILGCHWYSENGRSMFNVDSPALNVLDFLKAFNKPIWITEINKYNGSKYHSEKEQADMMSLFFNNLNQRPEVNAFFVYELYDQPHLATQKWVDYQAAFYGIVSWKNNPPIYTEFDYKPVSTVLKYNIEEFSYGYEDYIYSILNDFYRENPSIVDFDYWTSHFKNLKNKKSLINEILQINESLIVNQRFESYSSKEFSAIINEMYQMFLERSPIEKETKYWNRQLNKKMTFQDLLVQILLSEEYWKNAIWEGYERRTGYTRP